MRIIPKSIPKSILKSIAVGIVGSVLGALVSCSSGGITVNPGATSKADFCKLIIAFKTANDSLGNELTQGTPAQAKAAMQHIVGQVETLQQRAPSDVKQDVAATVTYLHKFDAVLAKYDYDRSVIAANATVGSEIQALGSEQINASLARLGTYSSTECGATATTPAASTTPTP